MLRKVGFIFALILSLPAFANAWTITAKIGSGAGTVASDSGGALTKTQANPPVLAYFKVDNTDPEQRITVTPSATYGVSSVILDGKNITTDAAYIVSPNVYKVAAGTPAKNHAVVVYYTSLTYKVSVSQVANGVVTVQALSTDGKPIGSISQKEIANLKPGAKVKITATPNADYVVTDVAGQSVTGKFPGEAASYIYTVGSSNPTFSGAFQLVPSVRVTLSPLSMTGTVNQAIPVSAQAIANAKVTYTFSYTGGTLANGDAANKKIYTPTEVGNNTVTVVATAGGISDTQTITFDIKSVNATANNVCLGCHATRNPTTKVLAEPEKTCSSCHNPKNTDSHQDSTVMATPTDKFSKSRHWNNHYEYGPEFRDYTTGVMGVLNANDSYTTDEQDANGVWKRVTCSTKCHFRNIKQKGVYGCQACHSDGLLAGGTFKNASTSHGATKTVANNCLNCHSGSKHGKVPTEFFGSKHWNNTFEYGPEFKNQAVVTINGINVTKGAPVDGQLNANDSYATLEDDAPVTCAYRCHFRPGMGPDPTKRSTGGITWTDPQTGEVHNRSTGDACIACHDAHGLEADYKNTCLTCHSGSKHGKVPNEFFNSKHWKNSLENGPEFSTQLRTTVVGGSVVSNGLTDEGVLNANDSYITKEEGEVVTCAYRCHFRPGMYPEYVTPPADLVANKKAITYVTYSAPTGGKYTRPGGNACMACHNAHSLEASARNTCYTCHTGGKHGWAVKTFEASKHFLSGYAVAEGIGGPNGQACTGCHNPHSTEVVFLAMSSATAVEGAVGCQRCHTPGATYAIYGANRELVAPHGGGAPTYSGGSNGALDNAGAGWPTAKTQYMAQGMTCGDCHGHNTEINAEFAESGHGEVSDDPMNAFVHYDWSKRTNDGSRANGNCGRCHATYGFLKFANQTTGLTRLQLKTGQTNAVLACITCHSNVASGALRDIVTKDGNIALKNGYVAKFVQAGQTEKSVTFPGFKNSNICVPCHSGRTTGSVVKDYYALGNYTTGTTGFYQHAANIGQTFIGTGAYEFNSANYANLPKHHTGAGMSINSDNGPCATCHNPHSLNVDNFASCATQYCHASGFGEADVARAKTNYDASVAVLTKLVQEKLHPLFADQSKPITEERTKVFFGRFNKIAGEAADSATASKAAGAWYNWHILTNADTAAYAHNPAYARAILLDTIDFLDDGVMNGSASKTVANSTPTGNYAASSFVAGQGCNGCHYDVLNTKHFANVTTLTKASYITARSECLDCHTRSQYHYATPSVNTEWAETGHGDLNGAAWTGRQWSQRADCNVCHSATGFRKFVASNFQDASAWASKTEGANEVLSCRGCHTDSANFKGSVVSFGTYTAGMGGFGAAKTAKVVFQSVGESNVCIPCHAARENGGSINASTADFSSTDFKNPHYLAAAAVFYGKGGFQFYTSGVRYNTYGAAGKVGANANWDHGKLGMGNFSSAGRAHVGGLSNATGTKGQCIACHLGKNNTHTFDAYTVAKSTWGGATANGCYGCHSNENMEEVGVEEKALFDRALDYLAYNLEAYGLFFNNDKSPYFFNTAVVASQSSTTKAINWATDPNGVGATGKMTMGAALNLKLLAAEKGSHVHNRAFARALITDSVVYLQKGPAGIAAERKNPLNNPSFTAYSTAVSGGTDRIADGKSGSTVSISGLKGYLIKNGLRR